MSKKRPLNRTLPRPQTIAFLCTLWMWLGSPTNTLTAQHIAAKRQSASRDVRVELDSILDVSGNSKLKFAGRVIELPSGRVVYDHNGKTPMIPASCMKLIVIAAAIDHLGTGFQFETVCAIRGKDLVVRGSGDPTIGDERLARARGESITEVFGGWARRLADAGIKQIPGDIIIDDSIFDDQFVHPNWPPEQFQEWYEAPVGGLNFNDNCVDLRLTPGKAGKPANVSFVPGNTALSIVNQTTSGQKHAPRARRKKGTDQIVVSGPVSKTSGLGPISVRDPGLFFGSTLKTVLASRGIKVGGTVRRAKLEVDSNGQLRDAHVVGVHKSPLRDALARAGKQSLGMMAEALLKLLGSRGGSAGSWSSGRAVVESFLQKAGVSSDEYKIDEGSGLSRYNRLSPHAMTQTLQYVFNGPKEHFIALRDSLSIAGVDGTLEKRLKEAPYKGRVFAKTGYINGVRTLAGYVHTRDDRWLAFAFFYNQATATRPLSAAQDKACRLLVNLTGEAELSSSLNPQE